MPPKRKAANNAIKTTSNDSNSSPKIKKTRKASPSPATDDGTKPDADAQPIVTKKLVIKGKIPVDSECLNMVNTSHVYCNGTDVYNFMLNQTNLQFNNNKYYLGQVLEDDNSKLFHTWFRWGRVGKTAQSSLTPFGGNFNMAIAKFCKTFHSKTGNHWNERNNFQKKNLLYDLIEQDFGNSGDQPVEEEEKEPEKMMKSTLPSEIYDLITTICDVKRMEQTMREMNYDARRAPLGKLTTAQIKAGYSALSEISNCLDKLKLLETPTNTTKVDNKRTKRVTSSVSEIKQLKEDLLLYTNLFYTRIPHDFGMRVPPLIDNPQSIKDELELLNALEDIEVAFSIIKREKKDNTDPVDRHYTELKCNLKPLVDSDEMLSIIKTYVKLTHASTHSNYDLEVLQVFKCEKDEEKKTFKDYGKRMLLWHGSRLTNWMGILGRGLRIAPPEAPSTGYMFGKGVYFADCASKSANYAYTSRNDNIGIMALCEVSLGEITELLQSNYNASKLASGKHSVKGIGRESPDPKSWITLKDGLVVPSGKLVGSSNKSAVLMYNEYIVYDTNQIRLRYLVKMKFNYKY